MALITIGSLVQSGQVAEIDPYSPTALEDEYKSINSNVYSLALRDVGPAPKMFLAGTSSLPEFTASGIAPESLLKLPYRVRHAAAADPDRSKPTRTGRTPRSNARVFEKLSAEFNRGSAARQSLRLPRSRMAKTPGMRSSATTALELQPLPSPRLKATSAGGGSDVNSHQNQPLTFAR